MAATQKSLPMDPSIYGPAILQSKSGLGGAGNIASPCIKTWTCFYLAYLCFSRSRISLMLFPLINNKCYFLLLIINVMSSSVKTIWVHSGVSGIT